MKTLVEARAFRPASKSITDGGSSGPGLKPHTNHHSAAGLKLGASTVAGRVVIRCFLTLALMVAVSLPIFAQQSKEPPLPKDLPPYGALKPFTPPNVHQEKLPNGLTLWLVSEPGFPKVAFAAAVRGGLASDPAKLPGLSELLADTVNQGTKTRTAKEIAEEIQASGGDLSVSSAADSVILSTEVLAEKTEPALAVLADILQNATFPDSEVELARRNLSDSLRAREAQPSFLASRALAQAVFGEHPYHVIATTQAALAAMRPAELRAEYTRRFRPDQAFMIVAGDFDAVKMIAAVRKALGNWKAPAEAPIAAVPPPPTSAPHAIFFVPRAGSVQTTLVLAQFGPTRQAADYAQAHVANAIYGGMFGSRLIRNIREEKGYAYSPFSMLQTRRLAGLFRTQADVRNEVTGPAFKEIESELNRIATSEPAADEVQRAQRYLVGNKAISLQSRAALARELATIWVDGLPPAEVGLESQRIQQVTPQQVQQVAAKYLPPAHATVVAVGEPKIVQEQLGTFGMKIEQPKLPDQAPASQPSPAPKQD